MRTGLVFATALLLSGSAYAQVCDDLDTCTINDMCNADGSCSGSFQSGATCDDFDECTVNDRCKTDPQLGNICRGDPAAVGTACGGGCGTCQPVAPFPGAPVQCMGDAANAGAPCTSIIVNPCVEGKCSIAGGFAFCEPQVKTCPDTDGNPCTDVCNFETGRCEPSEFLCVPVCEKCNPSNGTCAPANVGKACDDFNPCTAQSHCETSAAAGQTVCVAGPPTTPSCVGDCDGNGQVTVNEVVIGVNIALGSAQLSQCPSFDTNGDHMVEINELVGGVNSLLNGCA